MMYMVIFKREMHSSLSSNISLASPKMLLDSIKKVHRIDSVISIQLIEILGKPFYRVRCITAMYNEAGHKHDIQSMNHLANAETGQLRGPLLQEEAIEGIKIRFNGEPKVASVKYLTTTAGHHEYRGKPLTCLCNYI